ncbi:hypothetical protein AB4Z45_27835 [Paenibacillus sp. MCAF9]|uniref:hypothetical protein n=1 Tax=Paenibacillus sp. MCAF9 TaxID=3233046 RepID=UPI003F967449
MNNVEVELAGVMYRLIATKSGINYIEDMLMMGFNCSASLKLPPFTTFGFDLLVCVHSGAQISQEHITIWHHRRPEPAFYQNRYKIFLVLRPFVLEEIDRKEVDRLPEFRHLRLALLPL